MLVLTDPQAEAHRDHLKTYALTSKFMRVWPNEKLLRSWIMHTWKPKGEVGPHLSYKVFLTIFVPDLKHRDKIFNGGPYFLLSKRL